MISGSLLVAKRKRVETGFGKRLREMREAAGLTQSELGERIDMTYQAVAKYERGATEPSWAMVLRFAEALKVTPMEFLDPTETEPASKLKKPKP